MASQGKGIALIALLAGGGIVVYEYMKKKQPSKSTTPVTTTTTTTKTSTPKTTTTSSSGLGSQVGLSYSPFACHGKAPSYTFPYQEFTQGAKGSIVRALQTSLDYLGISVAYSGGPAGGVDGNFGPVTDKGVKKFQSEMHIWVDGIVGPQTWNALNIALTKCGGYWHRS